MRSIKISLPRRGYLYKEIFRLLKSTTHPAPVAKTAGSATRRIVRFRVSRVVAVSMREDGQVA